eukprot:7004768-Heterocapsa_arctica.AAC.1
MASRSSRMASKSSRMASRSSRMAIDCRAKMGLSRGRGAGGSGEGSNPLPPLGLASEAISQQLDERSRAGREVDSCEEGDRLQRIGGSRQGFGVRSLPRFASGCRADGSGE